MNEKILNENSGFFLFYSEKDYSLCKNAFLFKSVSSLST